MSIEGKILFLLKASRVASAASAGYKTYAGVSDAVESLTDAKDDASEAFETCSESAKTIRKASKPGRLETLFELLTK